MYSQLESQTKTKAETNPLVGEVPAEFASLDGGDEDAESLPTLADVGCVLPIGYIDPSGTVHREFDLVDWSWEIEEELGELAEKDRDMPMGVYVSELVGRGLRSLGTLDCTKLKRSQRRLILSRMFFSDVLYLYIWLRIKALGHELRLLDVRCTDSKCKKAIKEFTGDLRTLEVRSFGEVPKKVLTLETGVVYANERRKKVTVGPVSWALMETCDASTLTNPAKFKLATLQHGIRAIEGAPAGPVHLTRDHLRTMAPSEVNQLVAEIDRCNGGAVMQIGGLCPACKREFRQDIDWSHGAFFAPSSR